MINQANFAGIHVVRRIAFLFDKKLFLIYYLRKVFIESSKFNYYDFKINFHFLLMS